MPEPLISQLQEFEIWATANQKAARRETIFYWLLKIPVILLSAGAGVFACLEWKLIPVISGSIASPRVLIDGLQPRVKLRNVHLQAFYVLRNLQHKYGKKMANSLYERKK